MVAEHVGCLQSSGVTEVKTYEVVVGQVQGLEHGQVRHVDFRKAVVVHSQLGNLCAAFNAEFRKAVAAHVEFGECAVALGGEARQFIAAHVHFLQGVEAAEVEHAGELLVFPLDGGDVAAGHGYALPGGGIVLVGYLQCCGIGGCLCGGLCQESLKLFEFAFVYALCE